LSRVPTIFIGSGGFGVETLRRLAQAEEVELVGVVTAPPRPSGRHGTLTPTPIEAAAQQLAVASVLRPVRLRATESLEAVAALQPALAILADYGQLVPRAILELPYGALNLHPSLLPRHRGATPIQATILAGDAETGVTLMKMDTGLDTGPIVAQRTTSVQDDETAPVLEERLTREASALVGECLAPWLHGEVKPRPQDESQATMTKPLRREDGRLDPQRSVVHLERQVRAYQPWPGTWLETVAGRLVVLRAEAIPGWTGGAEQPAGRFGRFGLYVADGYLALREVQPAGGRPMTFDELVRGRPQIVGSDVVGSDVVGA
jgi:methionyl-tRNA formyltransferase